jgi:alpha-galactosidase
MNGQFGISSPVYEWSPELKKRAAENVALYKRLRPLISNSDIYHLTPPPEAGNNPKGWMALQYSSEDRTQSVLMAYRLGHSECRRNFRLRGLDPKRNYRIVEEGRKRGTYTGQQLSTEGLAVELDSEWRSAVIELEAEP